MSTYNGNSRAFSRALLVGTVTLLGALQMTAAGGTAVDQRGGADEGARLLAGAIDIHVHTLPTIVRGPSTGLKTRSSRIRGE